MNPLLNKSDYSRFSVDRIVTSEKDPILRKYKFELLLAGKVIIQLLGKDWWKRAEKEVRSAVEGTQLEKPRSHPLSRFYGSGDVSGFPLMTSFASDLLDCADNREADNLDEKIKELRTDSFFRTWFEIHTAAKLIRKGKVRAF